MFAHPIASALALCAIFMVGACASSEVPREGSESEGSVDRQPEVSASAEGDMRSDSQSEAGPLDTGSDRSLTTPQGDAHHPHDSEQRRDGGVPIAVALSCSEDQGVIRPTPESYSDFKAWGFTRYAELLAPNGKPIRIFAAEDISDAMIHRARNVLRFFLSDHPGSTYGGDKALVANSMADHQAALMLPEGAHEEGHEPPLNAQPLYESEMSVEGSAWYIDNDWDHRDATFEEIFHLVHDTGIGTYLPGALPEYQDALLSEAKAAIADGRWGISIDPSISDWLEELAEEHSLAQEYIASVIDSYYGYWGAFDAAPGGMWGIYIAKDRDEVQTKDPKGLALLEAFLPDMAHYEARLSDTFTGTFKMGFDPDTPYTHKSRYLVAVTLSGDRPSSIKGNAADNVLRGNQADNTLDGGAGKDRVIYCQERAAYTITSEGEVLIVDGPDGRDTLKDIEELHFKDTLYSSALFTP